jgi:hypothetical protein
MNRLCREPPWWYEPGEAKINLFALLREGVNYRISD